VLSKAGIPTTVLEKAPFVGGLARTIRRQTEYGEFRFDIGGHRWFTKNDELNELFREVVADELLWVNRISRIYFDGKYVDYPLKISNALKAIGPVVAAKAMADYGRTRVQQRVRPTPVESMRATARPGVALEPAWPWALLLAGALVVVDLFLRRVRKRRHAFDANAVEAGLVVPQ
jgi:protoporphyrinogen oxidase